MIILLFINMSTAFEFLIEECKLLVKQLSKCYQDKAPSRRLIKYCNEKDSSDRAVPS